jgi:hypothetical protein
MFTKMDFLSLELEQLDMMTSPVTYSKKKKASSLQARRRNAASCILFAMPKTGLKRELQAITPLKFFGNESA